MTLPTDSKPTNPKDVIGSGKLPLELVPDTATAYMALSFLEGALKYGRFNWRVAGVRASIYAAAARRHFNKWWNGEDEDPQTHVHHLASVMACCAIVLDAKLVGKLTDDRPPTAGMGELIESLEGTAAHLRRMFADRDPKQYTIADSATPPVGRANCAICGYPESDYFRYQDLTVCPGAAPTRANVCPSCLAREDEPHSIKCQMAPFRKTPFNSGERTV